MFRQSRGNVRRAATACCVSKSTVQRCRHDTKPPKETALETALETVANSQLGWPRITTDNFTCSASRRIVHSFYRKKDHSNMDIRRSGGEADY